LIIGLKQDTYQVQMPSPPRESRWQSASGTPGLSARDTYISASFARVCDIIGIHGRVHVVSGRFHVGGLLSGLGGDGCVCVLLYPPATEQRCLEYSDLQMLTTDHELGADGCSLSSASGGVVAGNCSQRSQGSKTSQGDLLEGARWLSFRCSRDGERGCVSRR